MDDVVAVALITAGSGLGGGLLTYFSARRQADRQADAERARLETELQRLRLEQEEPHFQHRQGVYHQLLDILAQWHGAYTMQGIPTIPERTKWLQECETRFNAVLLFGSRPVFETIAPLKGTLEVGMEADGASFAGSQQEKDFKAAYERTLDAMRNDTAPGGI
jgi:hypothetical protein